MNFKPHDYQQYAIESIIKKPNIGLFLDMGLGKTVITLTAIYSLIYDYFEVAKVLVIAPKRVAESTWPTEIAKWEHLKGLSHSLVLGSSKERSEALMRPADIYIINRENLSWLVENYNWDFDMVVIDELSSFKSPKVQRFKSLKRVRAKSPRLVGLTGTPAPNNLLELWPQVYLLDGGERLGRFITRFRDDYFVPDKRNREIVFSYKPKPGAERKIYERIGDICYSLKAEDYLNMPKLLSLRYEVELEAKERAAYDKFCRDKVLELEGQELDAVNAAALSNKLLQMANGAVYDSDKEVLEIHSRKLDALEDITESANGKPLLVAYWYKHDRDRIKARFKKARDIDTAEDIADWNAGSISIGLIHPASAGHGLNLQAGGNYIVWYSLTWSLELYQQLNARLWRQGQTAEQVIIQHLISKDTLDERVIQALETKEHGQNALIDAVKAELGGSR